MYIKFSNISPKLIYSTKILKSYLRITGDDQDALLESFQRSAIAFVEKRLGRSLLSKHIEIHHDNAFLLPFGPVVDIIEEPTYVSKSKNKSSKSSISKHPLTYTLTPYQDSFQLNFDFHWSCPMIRIVYKAGYANPEDIPACQRHAVLGTINWLYRGGKDLPSLDDHIDPWLKTERSYNIVVAA